MNQIEVLANKADNSEKTKETQQLNHNNELISKLDKPLSDNNSFSSKTENYTSVHYDPDKPLNSKIESSENVQYETKNISELDKPLNSKKIENIERMQPPVEITFKCPPGIDRQEFIRQIKGQERGLNSQTVYENRCFRENFEKNGRNMNEARRKQEEVREKALASRIISNQKNGMSYNEAKSEAEKWIKSQAALHNPDQIAGGNPVKVSRMGDARVNSSIGSQWRNNVKVLKSEVDTYAKGKSDEELKHTLMNVKLKVA